MSKNLKVETASYSGRREPPNSDCNRPTHRGADKSLARPGRKQANIFVRMASISFGALPYKKKELYDDSRLDIVEIARFPDMLPSLFPSWSG